MTRTPTTDELFDEMRAVPETVIVHQAILRDDTAFTFCDTQATLLWERRTLKNGHQMDRMQLAFDLGNRIKEFVNANRPPFTAELWDDALTYFLDPVNWFLIAEFHFTRLWELGEIDGWYESDPTVDQMRADFGADDIVTEV